MPTLIILSLFFAIIVFFLYRKPVFLTGNAIFIFQTLFPSWKFFEDIGVEPILYVRQGETQESLGEWKELLAQPKRKHGALFLNARGNLLFSCNSVVEGFIATLDGDENVRGDQKTGEIESTVYYRLTKSVALYFLQEEEPVQSGYFQFKIGSVDQGSISGNTRSKVDEVYTSPICEVNSP